VTDWGQLVSARLTDADWPAVAADVGPFLEREEDAALVTRENVLALLAGPPVS
jgi:hypothetical protein